MHPRLLFASPALLVAVSACLTAPSAPTARPTDSPAPPAPIETPAPTDIPPPTSAPAFPMIWTCFGCPTDDLWVLDPEGAHTVSMQDPLGQFYDSSQANGQILGASQFADRGAGPGSVAVSDLRTSDREGNGTALISEQVVVEGLWMPDGIDVVSIRALPDTYELRLLEQGGGDRLLASEVAFTFSPSPHGKLIAFTRESRYGLEQAPKGLFVVDRGGGPTNGWCPRSTAPAAVGSATGLLGRRTSSSSS